MTQVSVQGTQPPSATGFFGPSMLARAARGSTWTALSFFISQGGRFAANLILARLLFPEAFGIMALVTMVLVGLAMLSDMGLGQSIMQSKRGDDQTFLNTAWTLQIARGGLLWLVACALAFPISQFYDQPSIALMLPTAGIALLFAGLEPMRVETANRHLLIGRVTMLDLIATMTGIVVMVLLAWATGSSWALIAGWVVTGFIRLVLMWCFLPGAGNRLRLEANAATELLHFGFWIFLSSICGFLVSQGDKAILGRFLNIDGLGIYNIGMFLALFPMMLGTTITSRILIPLYREHLTDADDAARERLFRLRYFLTAGLIAALFLLALAGPWLVTLLYDERYVAAGAVMTAIATVHMISVVSLTYDQAALATGDSRGFFFVSAAKAIMQTVGFLLGVMYFGLIGGFVGLMVAKLMYYPVIASLARQHGAWDKRHDLVFLPLVMLLAGFAIWFTWSDIQVLWPNAQGALQLR